MKKITMILAVCLCAIQPASAQHDLMFGGGLSLLVGTGSVNVTSTDPNTGGQTSSSATVVGGGYAATLWPRYNIIQNDNNSVSVGIPLSIGFSGQFNSQSGGSLSFLLDAPLTLDYNIGHASSKDCDKNFGAFFGLGLNYFSSSASPVTDNGGAAADVSTMSGAGFLLHGGVRFPVREKSITLRLSYSVGSISVFGAGLIYNFGVESN